MTNTPQFLRLDSVIGYVSAGNVQRPVTPTREFVITYNELVRRLGGQQFDGVDQAGADAAKARGQSDVLAAGGVLPMGGSSPALSPAYPLSLTLLSKTQARIDVAEHTRTGAAAAIIAGSVIVARASIPSAAGDVSYTPQIVYYVDPGNAGGAVTFLATTDPAVAQPYRIVGVIATPATYPDMSGL